MLRFLKIFVVFIIIFCWIFSGWPRIWQNPAFPPEVKEIYAQSCGFGSPIGGGQCQGFIISTASTTWSVPGDWSNASNTIEVIGGGGGGASGAGSNGTPPGGGGGGGAYARIDNINLGAATSIKVQVGSSGGTAATGTISFFNWNSTGATSTCSANMSVCAAAGRGASGATGGAGGSTANSTGTVKFAGGNGGTASASTTQAPGAGGGGAGGPNGAGGRGGNGAGTGGYGGGGGGGNGGGSNGATSTSATGAAGGNNYSSYGGGSSSGASGTDGGGGAGSDGTSTGAAGQGGSGSKGLEWVTQGSGGGGGGGGGATQNGSGADGGPGGLIVANTGAGGGGGGSCRRSGCIGGTGAAGASGIIVVTYTPLQPTYNQSAYRWFNNQDSTQIGSALTETQDASTTVPASSEFRLRLLLYVTTVTSTAGSDNFKLQFATSTPGNCAFDLSNYTDVLTSGTDIRFYDNSTPNDGDSLTASSSDPVYSGSTVNQTYEEANNFTVTSTIGLNKDGQWDFSLKDNLAQANKTYCFRVVKSDDTQLTTYNKVPEITTSAATISCSTNITATAFGAIPFDAVATSSANASTTISCGAACTLYIKDNGDYSNNPGLWNATSSKLIKSPNAAGSATTTLQSGVEGYGIRATTTATGSGGTLSVALRYNITAPDGLGGSVNDVGGLLTSDIVLASSTSGITNREIIVIHKAAASSTTPVGTYDDTITYSCLAD